MQEIVSAALLTQMVILLVATLTLPFILRFGMTKATRIAPMVLIFAISGAAVLISNTPLIDGMEAFFNGMGQLQAVAAWTCVVLVILALYVASALIAGRLYEHREL